MCNSICSERNWNETDYWKINETAVFLTEFNNVHSRIINRLRNPMGISVGFWVLFRSFSDVSYNQRPYFVSFIIWSCDHTFSLRVRILPKLNFIIVFIINSVSLLFTCPCHPDLRLLLYRIIHVHELLVFIFYFFWPKYFYSENFYHLTLTFYFELILASSLCSIS